MAQNLYQGYTEPEWKVQDRMNRRNIANVEFVYGEGWEETADKLHAAIELANAQEFLSEHPAEVAYKLEKAMDKEIKALLDDPSVSPLEKSNALDSYLKENWDSIPEIPL